jgi:hypothetical protein
MCPILLQASEMLAAAEAVAREENPGWDNERYGEKDPEDPNFFN